jgi:hypothetical protein
MLATAARRCTEKPVAVPAMGPETKHGRRVILPHPEDMMRQRAQPATRSPPRPRFRRAARGPARAGAQTATRQGRSGDPAAAIATPTPRRAGRRGRPAGTRGRPRRQQSHPTRGRRRGRRRRAQARAAGRGTCWPAGKAADAIPATTNADVTAAAVNDNGSPSTKKTEARLWAHAAKMDAKSPWRPSRMN